MEPIKLTAVGVGPGDAELITVKGLNRLQSAELIFVPRSRDGSISLAQRIVNEYIAPEQTVIPLPLPMTRDANLLIPAWEAAAGQILQAYAEHEATRGVYILLGDPLLYGTFTYIWERLTHLDRSLDIEIVPGVTSFAATAALTQTILSTTNDRLAILPASYETNTAVLEKLFQQFDTIILMKVGPVLPQILSALDSLGVLDTAVYGERVGMPEEKIVTNVRELMGKKRPYLSLLIVKKS